jgi:hypothetical protein
MSDISHCIPSDKNYVSCQLRVQLPVYLLLGSSASNQRSVSPTSVYITFPLDNTPRYTHHNLRQPPI